MELNFDQHGMVHFQKTRGKTHWVNDFETVNQQIVAYLNAHQGDLDYVWQTYANNVETSFYIVDLMGELNLPNEEEKDFVIQGGYRRGIGTVYVNYHMYPANNSITKFGIGTTNNSAIEHSKR